MAPGCTVSDTGHVAMLRAMEEVEGECVSLWAEKAWEATLPTALSFYVGLQLLLGLSSHWSNHSRA